MGSLATAAAQQSLEGPAQGSTRWVRQEYGGCFSLSARDRLYGVVRGPDRDGRAAEWTQSHGAILF